MTVKVAVEQLLLTHKPDNGGDKQTEVYPMSRTVLNF